MKPEILTKSGNFFNFLSPHESEFDITDIAHGLSNICRFNGQCSHFYSVAQHSVLASMHITPEFAFDALMHDAAEAFIGDVTSPLKQLLPEYKIIEHRVEQEISNRFGVSFPLPPQVKEIDLIMVVTEKRDLLPHIIPAGSWECVRNIVPLTAKIDPWPPAVAYACFLNRYHQLCAQKEKETSNGAVTREL